MRHWPENMERVRDPRAGVAIRFCSDTQGACSAGAPGPDAMHAIARPRASSRPLRRCGGPPGTEKLQARGAPATSQGVSSEFSNGHHPVTPKQTFTFTLNSHLGKTHSHRGIGVNGSRQTNRGSMYFCVSCYCVMHTCQTPYTLILLDLT